MTASWGEFFEKMLSILLQLRRNLPRNVVSSVRIGTDLAVRHRTNGGNGHVGREIKVQEHCAERGIIRGVTEVRGADRNNCVGADPFEQNFGLEDVGVRASLSALATGGSRIVQGRPTANDILGNLMRRVGKGGVSAVQ